MIAKAKPKNHPFLKPAGYGLLALLVFSLTLWQTLPYRDFANMIEGRLAAHGVIAEISGLEPVSVLTYSVEKLVITSARGFDGEVELRDITLTLPLGDLVSMSPRLVVDGELFGGRIKGDAALLNPDSAQVSWQGVKLAELEPFSAIRLPKVRGTTSGNIRVKLPLQSAQRASGLLAATISGAGVGPGELKGFTIPSLELGDGSLDIEVDGGRINFGKVNFAGGDVGLGVDGSITIANQFKRSALDLSATIRPTREAERKLSIPFSMLAQYKKPDGTVAFRVTGTPASPHMKSF